MSYDEQTRLYTVFGRIVPVMNRVRDGRNPSTGAFSAFSRLGAVELVKDYPIKENLTELTLPDSTGYAALGVVPPFPDVVAFSSVTAVPTFGTYGVNTPTCYFVDFNEQQVNCTLWSDGGTFVQFAIGDCVVIMSRTDYNLKWAQKDGLSVLVQNFHRDEEGNLLVNGTNSETGAMVLDYNLGLIFNSVQF